MKDRYVRQTVLSIDNMPGIVVGSTLQEVMLVLPPVYIDRSSERAHTFTRHNNTDCSSEVSTRKAAPDTLLEGCTLQTQLLLRCNPSVKPSSNPPLPSSSLPSPPSHPPATFRTHPNKPPTPPLPLHTSQPHTCTFVCMDGLAEGPHFRLEFCRRRSFPRTSTPAHAKQHCLLALPVPHTRTYVYFVQPPLRSTAARCRCTASRRVLR